MTTAENAQTQEQSTLQNEVQTFFSIENYPAVLVGTLASYGLLEVMHHLVLETYLLPWLSSMGLGMTTCSLIYGTALLGTVALAAWGLWKFLKKSE